MKIFSSLNDLVFPHRCISCGALGISICSQCRRGWNPHKYLTSIDLGATRKLTVTSSILYSSIAQKVILAAKESHIKRADELVAEAIAHSLRNILRSKSADLLIPIPSRRAAVRLRGRQFVADVARQSSQESGIPIAMALTYQKSVRDQSGLSHVERWNNLQDAFVVKEKDFLGKRVLLIDDLVTTGATLSEAARALNYAGIEVVGAVTAAVARTIRIA